MKRGFVLLALLMLTSISAACGSGAVGSVDPDGTAEATREAAITAENPELVVGDQAVTNESGNKLTVYSYESPITLRGREPDPGFEFSAIDAEACNGPSEGRDLMQVGPNAFVLRLPDGTRVKPEVFADADAEVKQPALQNMEVRGACDRGFVTFQTPRGERPDLVIFEESFSTEAQPIEWTIPDE